MITPATGPGAPCAWCGEPIPEFSETARRTRRDATFCGKLHRQASHRFGARAPRFQTQGRAMRFAYADPPYPGLARRYYGDHPDYAGEVDHAALIGRLVAEYPDGWALSTHARSLRDVLALCPPQARVHAWVKELPPAKGRHACNRWEPVIFVGGRHRPPDGPAVRDWVRARPLGHHGWRGGRGVIGMKPPEFCWWLFDCLGAQPHDRFDDLFPGSGSVGEAWRRWTRRSSIDDALEAA